MYQVECVYMYEYSYVGMVHDAAAVNLVVSDYVVWVYPAQQTQPGPRH